MDGQEICWATHFQELPCVGVWSFVDSLCPYLTEWFLLSLNCAFVLTSFLVETILNSKVFKELLIVNFWPFLSPVGVSQWASTGDLASLNFWSSFHPFRWNFCGSIIHKVSFSVNRVWHKSSFSKLHSYGLYPSLMYFHLLFPFLPIYLCFGRKPLFSSTYQQRCPAGLALIANSVIH